MRSLMSEKNLTPVFHFAADDWLWAIYSDCYKDETGVRPRGFTPPYIAYNFFIRRENEAKANQAIKDQFPKRTLLNHAGLPARVIGYESDRFGGVIIKARVIPFNTVIELTPQECRKA